MALVLTGDEPTFDEEALQDGLQLSLIGLGVVFAVLSLLALSIKLFDRLESLIPADGASDSVASAPPARDATPDAEQVEIAEEDVDDAQTAAAIAVALALADEGPGPAPRVVRGARAETPGSAWTSTGRYREMSRRMTGPPARGRRDR